MKSFIPDSSPFRGSGYYFYDVNVKLNYKLGDKDRIFLSGYYGKDMFTYKSKDDNFNVQISSQYNTYFATSIIDATGKEVYKRSILANKIHSIETSGIAAAVYFLVVRDSEGRIVYRKMLLIL